MKKIVLSKEALEKMGSTLPKADPNLSDSQEIEAPDNVELTDVETPAEEVNPLLAEVEELKGQLSTLELEKEEFTTKLADLEKEKANSATLVTKLEDSLRAITNSMKVAVGFAELDDDVKGTQLLKEFNKTVEKYQELPVGSVVEEPTKEQARSAVETSIDQSRYETFPWN